MLASRQKAVDEAKKALQDTKVQVHKKETQLKGMQEKSAELRVKLNSIKKQNEYDAIRNQLAMDNSAQSKLSDEILEAMMKVDEQAAALAAQEAEVQKIAGEVAAIQADIAAKTAEQKGQLEALDREILGAETVIPEAEREHYKRVVKQKGADAMAAVEGSACTGCFVSVTAQMMNDLINGGHLVICKTCGRLLYLADEDRSTTRRTAR